MTKILTNLPVLNHRRLCSRVLELYRAHKITGIQPLKVFGVSDIEQALRYFSSSKRIGKVVISLNDPSYQIKVSNALCLFICAYK